MSGLFETAELRVIAGTLLALVLAALLVRQAFASGERRRAWGSTLVQPVADLLDRSELRQTGPNEPPMVCGAFRGLPVQARPVIDTLSTRKLPSLWLMLTMPAPLPVAGTFDFMLRPAGGSSFSNHDQLPHALPSPRGWPADGVLRTDRLDSPFDVSALAPLEPLLRSPQLKEILVSPQGLRIVLLLAEADRARYGVFRQAEFGDIRVGAASLAATLTAMSGAMSRLGTIRQAA